MKSCKHAETCMQAFILAWLAAYGGREMPLQSCEYCNVYQPEGEEDT